MCGPQNLTRLRIAAQASLSLLIMVVSISKTLFNQSEDQGVKSLFSYIFR